MFCVVCIDGYMGSVWIASCVVLGERRARYVVCAHMNSVENDVMFIEKRHFHIICN